MAGSKSTSNTPEVPKKASSKIACLGCGKKFSSSATTPDELLDRDDVVPEINFLTSILQTSLDRHKIELATSVANDISKYDTRLRSFVLKDLLCIFCKGLMDKSPWSAAHRTTTTTVYNGHNKNYGGYNHGACM